MLDDWTRKRTLFVALFGFLLVAGVALFVASWGDDSAPRAIGLQVLADAVLLAALVFRPGLLPGFESV